MAKSVSAFKFVSVSLLMACLSYLAVVLVWAWTHTMTLAHEALLSPYSALSFEQEAILLQVEDPTFYYHWGVDFSKGQGATTISSASAKWVYLGEYQLTGTSGRIQDFYRRILACCERFDLGLRAMALVLNARLTKQEQLQIFVANVPMGHVNGVLIKGLPEAAQVYFQVPLAELPESAWINLVAMIVAPDEYQPPQNNSALVQRSARVRRLLGGECTAQSMADIQYRDCDP